MRPHTIRLHIKRLVVDRGTWSGQSINEFVLAASLDQAFRSRFSEPGHMRRTAASHDVTSQIAEAISREFAFIQYPYIPQVQSAVVPYLNARPLSFDAARGPNPELKA